MSESVDEDIYKLEQMKSLASDMYNQRKHEKPGGNDVDRYAYHIDETIHHLRDAISERKSEEGSKNIPAGYAGNFPIQENTTATYARIPPTGEDEKRDCLGTIYLDGNGDLLTHEWKPRMLVADDGVVGDAHCGGTEISVDQADIYEAWERASLSYDALERLRECE